jgi:hypothetical protein
MRRHAREGHAREELRHVRGIAGARDVVQRSDVVAVVEAAALGVRGLGEDVAVDLLQRGHPRQREGRRTESYKATLLSNDRTYSYTTDDEALFRQLQPGSHWVLDVDNLGAVVAVKAR